MNKNTLRILVVDDDTNFTLTLSQILHLEGYECLEAHSVNEAESILSREDFDLILSDVRMPENSGPELYYRIKNRLPHIPFILMTAYSSNEIIEEALDAGILAALPKPIDIKNILSFLNRLNRGLYAAVICSSGLSCGLITGFLEGKKIKYSEFDDVHQLLKSDFDDFSLVFLDTHHPCENLKSEIQELRNHLPAKTIIVLCALSDTSDKDRKVLSQRLNLIILPHGKKALNNIDKILEKEYFQIAKNHFSRDPQ